MSRRVTRLCFVLLAAVATLAALLIWQQLRERQRGEELPPLVCPSQLQEFVACVREHMPRPGTTPQWEGPDNAEAAALADTARGLLSVAAAPGDACEIPLPSRLRDHYGVRSLVAGTQRYCALWENRLSTNGRVPLGWGTLIINRDPATRLVFGAPHPLNDLNTANQAADLLVQLDALGLVLAGSHRNASADTHRCAGAAHAAADASHSPSGYLAFASTVLQQPGAPSWFVEWHGMADPAAGAACFDPARQRPLDVYITEGASAPLSQGGFAAALLDALRAQRPDWHVAEPGSGVPCDKGGTTNLLGRLLNRPEANLDAATLCAATQTPATEVTGRFVHIEQLRCAGGGRCGSDGQPIRLGQSWHAALAQAYRVADAAITATPN